MLIWTMKTLLLAAAISVVLLAWRIDHVTTSRDALAVSLEESTTQAAGLRSTLQAHSEKLVELAALDAKHTKDLTAAQSENERLAADVAAGKRRLLIKAHCPAISGATDSTATSMDDGATAELSPTARQDYYTLRRQLTKTDKALAGLQSYVSEVCQK